jgi:purine-binding chemotaxis protein CheW
MNQDRPPQFDWGAALRRARQVEQSLEHGWEPSREEKRAILRERARALARDPAADQPRETEVEVVAFYLAHEIYGIETRLVREVHPLERFTPLPHTPAFLLGVTNIRGRILPVVDLKRFFGLPEQGLTDLNKVVIVQQEGAELGILADSILGVRQIPSASVQGPPTVLEGISTEYLRGVTEDRWVILDVERILTDERMVVRQPSEA